ncbi:hypothetical protein [Kitasatospora viridis]|uniref:Uncharacterized protein n=1 Tax=Kitasatospora viridis TaxID=281105 RepID=A0A561SE94_9ACTN|nr:hypothetical protein [Kitasatospora viridis]TWF73180.1 hypothetical protein FHX73_16331 [Kitasatospora viridis]
MDVGSARAAARHWVTTTGRTRPGYLGAYLVGSTTALPDRAELPLGSDVDVMLVTRQPLQGFKLGKFEHRGVLLEVSHLAWEQLGSVDAVLADYHLAGGLRRDTVIDDPSGALRGLQREVAARFAEPDRVRLRCRGVRERITTALTAADEAAPWHDRVTGWLFPTGVTAHLVLVAALRNPTVRLRYLRAREALGEFGLADRYPALLHLLGADQLTPAQVRGHVDALAITFDAAARVAVTPFAFSTDITPPARPIAVDASYELVRRGDHREAMFWIIATFARCHKILAADDPATEAALAPLFDAAVADLGITSDRDLRRHAGATLDALPGLWDTAEQIIGASARI